MMGGDAASAAITLPLDVVETLLASAEGKTDAGPEEEEAVALIARETEQVRDDLGMDRRKPHD